MHITKATATVLRLNEVTFTNFEDNRVLADFGIVLIDVIARQCIFTGNGNRDTAIGSAMLINGTSGAVAIDSSHFEGNLNLFNQGSPVQVQFSMDAFFLFENSVIVGNVGGVQVGVPGSPASVGQANIENSVFTGGLEAVSAVSIIQ